MPHLSLRALALRGASLTWPCCPPQPGMASRSEIKWGAPGGTLPDAEEITPTRNSSTPKSLRTTRSRAH
jgi:hypothetical protein